MVFGQKTANSILSWGHVGNAVAKYIYGVNTDFWVGRRAALTLVTLRKEQN